MLDYVKWHIFFPVIEPPFGIIGNMHHTDTLDEIFQFMINEEG